MIKLIMRKFFIVAQSLLLVLMLSIVFSSVVYAEESTESRQGINKASSTEGTRGTYLSEGTAEIVKLSSDELHILGVTNCVRTSDKVYLYLYLEQKVNGTYNSYRSWKFTKSDADYLTKGINVLVPSGYYYRVRGYHAAEKDGTKESVATCTAGILID